MRVGVCETIRDTTPVCTLFICELVYVSSCVCELVRVKKYGTRLNIHPSRM